jgi:hypothetical protein
MSQKASVIKPTLDASGDNHQEWSATLEILAMELYGSAASCITSLKKPEEKVPVKPSNLKEGSVNEILFIESVKAYASHQAQVDSNMPKILGFALNSLSPGFTQVLSAHPSYEGLYEAKDTIGILRLIQEVAIGKDNLDGTRSIVEKIELFTLRMTNSSSYEQYVNAFDAKVRRLKHLSIDIPEAELALIFLFNLDSEYFGLKVTDWISGGQIPSTYEDAKKLVSTYLKTRRSVQRTTVTHKGKPHLKEQVEEVANMAHNTSRECWFCKLKGKKAKGHDANMCRSLKPYVEKCLAAEESANFINTHGLDDLEDFHF